MSDDCQDVVELVTDYLEGALGGQERAAFEAHLGACSGCRHYLAQVRDTIRLLGRQAGARSLPADTVDGLVAAFRSLRSSAPAQRDPSAS